MASHTSHCVWMCHYSIYYQQFILAASPLDLSRLITLHAQVITYMLQADTCATSCSQRAAGRSASSQPVWAGQVNRMSSMSSVNDICIPGSITDKFMISLAIFTVVMIRCSTDSTARMCFSRSGNDQDQVLIHCCCTLWISRTNFWLQKLTDWSSIAACKETTAQCVGEQTGSSSTVKMCVCVWQGGYTVQ